jgi:methylmalonyl-CoA/ethylmalonyl-CoA epimerase
MSRTALTRIHHVGVVVRDLEQAYGFWRDVLGLPVHKVATVEDQGVRAALLTIGESEIELLEPLSPASGIGKFLAKRGEGLHHICYATEDVAGALDEARAKGVRLIDEKPRPGLAGTICFLHPASTHGVLVEYAQPFADEAHA